jgi:hypothetical protein
MIHIKTALSLAHFNLDTPGFSIPPASNGDSIENLRYVSGRRVLSLANFDP